MAKIKNDKKIKSNTNEKTKTSWLIEQLKKSILKYFIKIKLGRKVSQ